MAEQITNYQCPACGGPLHFAGASGKLECEYCGSSFEVAEIEKLYQQKDEKAADAFHEESEKQAAQEPAEDWDAAGDGMHVYNCPSCGAELICDENTAATSCPGRFVRYDPSGAEVLRRQVCVSYTHRGPCPIQPPVSQLPLLPHTAQALREGRPLTVLFYGDSFMEGCDASGRTGLAPYLPPLDWLVTMALADAYRHPSIRRINTAVGGTTSRWGLEQAKDRLAAYAPELAVIRFGMNDSGAGIEPEEYIRNLRGILAAGRQANAQMEFLLLASETPNPDCEGWTRFQRAYEQPLRELVRETPGCGFVSIAAPFDAASAAKGYPSLSANLVNHPNDFMIRVYAASIVQALLDAGTELVQ